MGELILYNRMTKKKEPFEPRGKDRVRLFTCGPSVYRRQHLGNYRTYLFEDVLEKYLEYKGYEVDRVINFTDLEDKAIQEAGKKDLSLEELRTPVEKAFFRESELLKMKLPKKIPRATTSVESAVELIERLLERGHAYFHKEEVFFDPMTYEGFGRLYGLDMSRWPKKKIRFRKDTYPGQRWNLGDFILWHKRGRLKKEKWWDTRLGQGRPAWNIQDAAMIAKHLGFEIDIHTGGIDNLYRHHDYTLAIMEGASGKRFCRWWLHGGHLYVDGRKMSKSKGNVTYVDDMLSLGFLPRHIRFFLLYGSYREKLDLRLSDMEERAGRLERIRHLFKALLTGNNREEKREVGDIAKKVQTAFEMRMDDNLDYAGAFDDVAGLLVNAFKDGNGGISAKTGENLKTVLTKMDRVFGVLE